MFGKMKKGLLEEECEKRNINHHGLTRKAMIATLEEYEKNGPEEEEEEAETEEEVGGDQMKLELIQSRKGTDAGRDGVATDKGTIRPVTV